MTLVKVPLCVYFFLVFISAIRQERFGESAKRFKAGSRGGWTICVPRDAAPDA